MKKVILLISIISITYRASLAQNNNKKILVQLQTFNDNDVPLDYGVGLTCRYSMKGNDKPVFLENISKKKAAIMIDKKVITLKLVKTHSYAGGGYKVELHTKELPGDEGMEGNLVVSSDKGASSKINIEGGCEY